MALDQPKPQENFPPQTEIRESQGEKVTDLPDNVLALADTPEAASDALAQKAAEKSAKILKPQMERFAVA